MLTKVYSSLPVYIRLWMNKPKIPIYRSLWTWFNLLQERYILIIKMFWIIPGFPPQKYSLLHSSNVREVKVILSSGRSIPMQAIIDILPTPDIERICWRWKGFEQWALSIPFWHSSSLGICVCQCRWHKPEGCARGQPDPASTQNLICTLNIVHCMNMPCVSTVCLYWVISAIGNFSFLNTDKITEDDNRFAGLPQADTSSWFF